ncbi:hypothetical protein TWF730_009988 [Orbilia blumenaviensis]|uniref:Histone-lysine N-methyltransferase n=1 Tax=Orbilia blumenaviensis TaxID=1796055 RepID=A0AAV9UWV1_9PEZI
MPFCIRHSMPAPRRRAAQTSTKWVLKREDTKDSHIAKARLTFLPCSHEGSCEPGNKDCSCSDEAIYCEKFCGCASDCPRRWKGCACRAGKPCIGDRCPCVRDNRECDPDLCLSCGADEQLDIIHRKGQHEDSKVASVVAKSTTKQDIRRTACQNVSLQLNEPPMTKVGPTSMPFEGNGLFAMETIKKGEFVGEYTGEVVSEEEADRRVAVYDSSSSFMFEINATHEVDGTQYGNKTRYLNHSKAEPNCEAKVLQVNGIHRIAFRALEDIEPGQELLFNYGESFFKFEGVEREGAIERETLKKNLQRLRVESDPEGGDETMSDVSDDIIVGRRSGRLNSKRGDITGSYTNSKTNTRRSRLSRIVYSDDEFSDDPVAAQIQREI